MVTNEYVHQVKCAAENDNLKVIRNYTTLSPAGQGLHEGTCPKCGGRHFSFDENARSYSCADCRFSGTDIVSFVMSATGADFDSAIAQIGNMLGIHQEVEQKDGTVSRTGTFCRRMLRESGLTEKDVTAKVTIKGDTPTTEETPTFIPGTINEKGEIIDGDDVIIRYFALDGTQVQYDAKDTRQRSMGVRRDYYRVRWQFPQSHTDKDGKPYKYKSPAGSGTPIYIPQHIREVWQKGGQLSRLFIQEGEKKAEKACKHGIPSIAISGIMNMGNNGSLSEDMVRIIRDCQVREVVFIMDSDWQDLSREKKLTEEIAKRPYNFYYAARNYREYMRGLKNENIYVEIFLGHVISHNGDKGLDDLLAHSLKGKENVLSEELDSLLNDQKHMTGEYCELFKITESTDHQLKMLWGLDNVNAFVERHRDELVSLPEFKFGYHHWKIDGEGNAVNVSPVQEDEKFWESREYKDKYGNPRSDVSYQYIKGRNFLEHHGFGRYRQKNGDFLFIHVEHPFVKVIQALDARDYLLQFAEANCPYDVREMLAKGASQYLGPDHLSQMRYITPNFMTPDRTCQYFYFRNSCWKVTGEGVEEVSYSRIVNQVWLSARKDFEAKYVGDLIEFIEGAGGRAFCLTDAGLKCHFLQFLINASDFTWNMQQACITAAEMQDNVQHLLSKLCAIGYLALDAKDSSQARAVIAMDGQQSEVGVSNGRTGKSLVGELLKRTTSNVYVDGKKNNLLDDPFVWHEITEDTRFVFIDDVRQSFNFESLFPCITGSWSINYKHGNRLTLPFETSPKIYISTNHAIKGDGSSFTDRQWLLAFSDYYNEKRKPIDDFGQMFFDDWDYEQWNLAWNLIANCVKLYLTYGVQQAPSQMLEQRKLRQEITEGFLIWADEYYSSEERLNVPIKRQDLQDSYFLAEPLQRKYVSPQEFKRRFRKYCELRGYILNPKLYNSAGKPLRFDRYNRPILDDKSNGIEYFTVGTVPGGSVTSNSSAPF